VKGAACIRRQSNDVARVGWDFGLNQNNLKHSLNCRRRSIVWRARDHKACDVDGAGLP
jgi:hypothetical protein